jgi:hypothetical protein
MIELMIYLAIQVGECYPVEVRIVEIPFGRDLL